jgi:hypothetical protein
MFEPASPSGYIIDRRVVVRLLDFTFKRRRGAKSSYRIARLNTGASLPWGRLLKVSCKREDVSRKIQSLLKYEKSPLWLGSGSSQGTEDICGRAVGQAVSRWLLTAAARVRVRIACGVCGGQSGIGGGFFSPSTSFFPANYHSTNFSIIITRGRSAEWTQLDSTPHYTN